MNSIADPEKLTQFNEFFIIALSFNVSVTKLTDKSLLDAQRFEQGMPLPFKMASELVSIDQSTLQSMQALKAHASILADVINLQSQKISMLVNYILSQHDDPSTRFQGTMFGGGGIVFIADNQFAIKDFVELKIFILEENCAVYCIGEIIDKHQVNEQWHYKVIFQQIREQDREVLVRTSLHEQSKQLQALSKQRASQSNNTIE